MNKEPAVTPVISEMLMIALVLILIPMVTISLMNQLPEGRVPTVTILMGVNVDTNTLQNVTLYHKGGDYVKKTDLQVRIRTNHNGEIKEFGPYNSNFLTPASTKQVFDLGDSLTTSDINAPLESGTTISVLFIVKNSVLFSGDYHHE